MKLFLLIWLLGISHGIVAANDPALQYEISPFKKGYHDVFLIKLSFKGSATGKTRMSVPNQTTRGLQNNIEIIQVSGATIHNYVKGDSGLYEIEHKPNANLEISYLLKNGTRDSVPAANEVNNPILSQSYFHVVGELLWVVPDNSSEKYNIRLRWKGFPPTWKYLNTFGTENTINFTSLLQDFQYAIYMGGDFRIHRFMVNAMPVYFGIRSNWSFTDQEVLDVIQKTVNSQRKFWNDYHVSRYTISLIPTKYGSPEERSITGRGLYNTFISTGTNSQGFKVTDIVYLYNHEFMHYWFGQVLKQGIPENAFKWFNEGFNDYFAHVVMLESQLLDTSTYKKLLNEIFSTYYSNSIHQYTNAELEKNYWSTFEMQRLPYKRGHIFAFYLNELLKIESAGKISLKHVLAHMLSETRVKTKNFSLDWLLKEMQQQTGKDYSSVFQQYISEGKFITPEDWKLVTDKISVVPTEVYHLGFTTDKGISLHAKITSVDSTSNVYKAGLQAGDLIAGFSSTMQASDSALIKVKRGDEIISIRFLPAKKLMVPQLR